MKPLIPPVDTDRAGAETQSLLSEIADHLGSAPNYLRTAAHSPTALRSLWFLLSASAQMTIPERIRHAIALRVAELNACSYSLASETDSSSRAGVEPQHREGFRRGLSDDLKEQALLALTTKVVRDKGCNAGMAISSAREAGVTDREIIETIALIATHVFANYLNNVAYTELDYPEAPALERPRRRNDRS